MTVRRRRTRTVAALVAAAAAVAAAALAAALLAGGGEAAPAGPRVVRVAVGDEVATGFSAGRGRIVTVAHVLAAGAGVRVAGRRVRVSRVDRRDDLAVLAVPGGAGPLRRASARAGEPVSVRVLRGGRATSLRGTVRRTTTARVRPLEGPVQVRPALELAATVEPGDSGAPVLDRDGRMVGVVFAKASERDGIAYAVDARVVRP